MKKMNSKRDLPSSTWRSSVYSMTILMISVLAYTYGCSKGDMIIQDNMGENTSATLKASSTIVQAEAYTVMQGVQIEACSEGGENVGWIDDEDWMVYEVSVPATGRYTLVFQVASPDGGGLLQFEQAGGNYIYGTVEVPATGGWQNWTTISLTTNLTEGSQELAIKAMRGGWNINWWKFSNDSDDGEWRLANLTNYESFPDPNSDECIYYNGCLWAGYFAFVDGKQTEEWVMNHNIASVHSRNADEFKLKTLRLRQGNKEIDVVVYDMCSDSDCNGCCTENADANGIGFLIDIEKYTMQRFGSGDGIVEWKCLDCD